jgi:hypothetical protein
MTRSLHCRGTNFGYREHSEQHEPNTAFERFNARVGGHFERRFELAVEGA